MRYEITYPLQNFNGTTVEVWEWVRNSAPQFSSKINIHPCWDLFLIQSLYLPIFNLNTLKAIYFTQ